MNASPHFAAAAAATADRVEWMRPAFLQHELPSSSVWLPLPANESSGVETFCIASEDDSHEADDGQMLYLHFRILVSEMFRDSRVVREMQLLRERAQRLSLRDTSLLAPAGAQLRRNQPSLQEHRKEACFQAPTVGIANAHARIHPAAPMLGGTPSNPRAYCATYSCFHAFTRSELQEAALNWPLKMTIRSSFCWLVMIALSFPAS
jgi:hypothetical protein